MKKIFLIPIVLLSVLQTFSQNTDQIVSQIIKNNPTLQALTTSNNADRVGNKTDLYLANPEVNFNYLFANSNTFGNRTDLSVSQSFDFPSAYVYKYQMATLKNDQLPYTYQQTLNQIVLQTKLTCCDLIYYNLLLKEYQKRYDIAVKIASATKRKFESGESTMLEVNKAELNKFTISKEIERIQLEKELFLNQLVGLNGNIPLQFEDTLFILQQIPSDFEQWVSQVEQRDPTLKLMKLEIEWYEKQKKYAIAMSLPKFKVGYMSELMSNQDFRGVSFGMSIPLWENKNKIKYAKLKTEAIQNYEMAKKIQFYNHLKALHTKTITLQNSLFEYELNLAMYNNMDLLNMALENGEIDLIHFMMEQSFYYESLENLLEMKRDLSKAVAEMSIY